MFDDRRLRSEWYAYVKLPEAPIRAVKSHNKHWVLVATFEPGYWLCTKYFCIPADQLLAGTLSAVEVLWKLKFGPSEIVRILRGEYSGDVTLPEDVGPPTEQASDVDPSLVRCLLEGNNIAYCIPVPPSSWDIGLLNGWWQSMSASERFALMKLAGLDKSLATIRRVLQSVGSKMVLMRKAGYEGEYYPRKHSVFVKTYEPVEP